MIWFSSLSQVKQQTGSKLDVGLALPWLCFAKSLEQKHSIALYVQT